MVERIPTNPWPARLEYAQAGLLAANLAWTTLCLGGYRPETMVVTSALTTALLALHLLARIVFPDAWGKTHPAGWLLLPFLAYAAANVLRVTPVRWLGWHDWLGWAQMIAVFWVVLNGVRARAAQRLVLGALALIGLVAVALAAYQIFVRPDWLMLGRKQAEQFLGRASGPFGVPNSLAALLLLLLPPLVAATFRRRASAVQRVLTGYLAVMMAAGLVFTASRGAWLGLAVAVMLWPLLVGRKSWAQRFGRVAVAAAAVAVIGGAVYLLVPKMQARFDAMVQEAGEKTRPVMWRGAWKLFEEHPVWGSGAGSYNVAFEQHRPEHYQLDSQWAHNDYLNTLSDYGAVGFVLFFGAVGAVIFGCVRRARTAEVSAPGDLRDETRGRRALALGLLAFGLHLLVDFHFKIPALAMAVAVVAGVLVQRTWPVAATPERRSSWRRVLPGGALCAVPVLFFGLVRPHYQAEALRYPARQALDMLSGEAEDAYRPTLERTRADLARATQIDPSNVQAWTDLAHATALWAHVEPAQTRALGMAAQRWADEALARTRFMPEPWIRRAVALDMQSRWLEAGDSLIQAMKLAPAQAAVWYYQAYHLSLNPVTRLQARAAVGICLRLDPTHRQAQLLRQQLATAP